MTAREWVRRVVLLLALPVTLVTVWWFASEDSTDPFFPSLERILEAFRETWVGPRLAEDLLPSVLRLAVGYAAALLLGVGIGLAIGAGPRLRALTEPVLEFLRAIPPPVLVPILILMAGIGDGMKVLVIIFGCIWPILLNTVEGVRNVDAVLADTCRSYRITGLARLRSLVLRSASPQIMTGARQALSIGIILMVISELFAANTGLGHAVVQFQRSFAYPQMWSGVLVLGLLGVLLALLFRLVESRVLRWYHGIRAVQKEW
jgi:ABC-type nitrate/sulfonate/bicarbonate transport system permease component